MVEATAVAKVAVGTAMAQAAAAAMATVGWAAVVRGVDERVVAATATVVPVA